MSKPRRVLPGQYHMLTRRCTQRQFLLRPDPQLTLIVAYCLAEAARRFNIHLIAWVVMSNHYHAVIYDPDGRVPAFIEHFHKMVARAVNAFRGRWENLWSSEETCVTHLATLEDVFDKVVYVLSNPMAAHLVDRAQDWPGLHSLNHLDGRTTTHKRPRWFFKDTGKKIMPDAVELRAVPPPTAKGDFAATWATRVRKAVAAKEEQYREARRKDGIRLLGRKGVLAAAPFSTPAKKTIHRKLRPALACKNPARRKDELKQLKGFYVEYARKLALYVAAKTGAEKHRIIFPAGTYRLRALGVRCAPFPS